jgi:hypothetical protein
VKDPEEVISPNRNLILIALRVEDPEDHISVTLLDDLPLDLGNGSGFEVSAIESLSIYVARLSHVVSCRIALSTDRVSSSNLLPSNPRSRAWHTSAQANPRSTYS